MQTNEQGSNPQTDPPAGAPPETGAQIPPVAEPPKEPDTVAVSKTDLDELTRLAKDAENYKGAVARLEQENSEMKTLNEELSQRATATPMFGQLPENLSEEEAKGIERDFKRQSRDVLARKPDLSDLTPKQRKEFDKQYQIQSSIVYQEFLKRGEYTPVSELEDSLDTALRFVKGITNEEELRKARLAGQADMLARDAGNVGNTTQSTTEKKVDEISTEAWDQARKSILIEKGIITTEEDIKRLAERIQKRLNEG